MKKLIISGMAAVSIVSMLQAAGNYFPTHACAHIDKKTEKVRKVNFYCKAYDDNDEIIDIFRKNVKLPYEEFKIFNGMHLQYKNYGSGDTITCAADSNNNNSKLCNSIFYSTTASDAVASAISSPFTAISGLLTSAAEGKYNGVVKVTKTFDREKFEEVINKNNLYKYQDIYESICKRKIELEKKYPFAKGNVISISDLKDIDDIANYDYISFFNTKEAELEKIVQKREEERKARLAKQEEERKARLAKQEEERAKEEKEIKKLVKQAKSGDFEALYKIYKRSLGKSATITTENEFGDKMTVKTCKISVLSPNPSFIEKVALTSLLLNTHSIEVPKTALDSNINSQVVAGVILKEIKWGWLPPRISVNSSSLNIKGKKLTIDVDVNFIANKIGNYLNPTNATTAKKRNILLNSFLLTRINYPFSKMGGKCNPELNGVSIVENLIVISSKFNDPKASKLLYLFASQASYKDITKYLLSDPNVKKAFKMILEKVK
ncbi:hypothetical protein [Hydrogenimonas thermophila]|uniref:Uncharacterized protein n=1 Tax=Hydrogenimonas thermophila TaxID=223786 RepID=A0A1I5LXV4_9BACT|nr:hypothetical protein [Hydrogenimonas thermophila]SFP02095.1 hypothetical protein SAMN05216234_10471 [Hydrogenimonas thermophila]